VTLSRFQIVTQVLWSLPLVVAVISGVFAWPALRGRALLLSLAMAIGLGAISWATWAWCLVGSGIASATPETGEPTLEAFDFPSVSVRVAVGFLLLAAGTIYLIPTLRRLLLK
jgi:hypothetical protein